MNPPDDTSDEAVILSSLVRAVKPLTGINTRVGPDRMPHPTERPRSLPRRVLGVVDRDLRAGKDPSLDHHLRRLLDQPSRLSGSDQLVVAGQLAVATADTHVGAF